MLKMTPEMENEYINITGRRVSQVCEHTSENYNIFIKDTLLTVALQPQRLLLFVFYKQTKRRLVIIFIYELDDLLVVHVHIWAKAIGWGHLC